MAFKFVLALAFVAAASAGYAPVQQVYQAAPVAHTVAVAQPVLAKNVEEYDPHPQYKYAYDVQDSITGDSKSQVETRDGDVVRGEYSLIDSDGYKRIVQYTADDVHGFNAVVTRVPVGAAIKTVAAAPVAYAAPAVVKTVAPVAYAAAPAYYKSAPATYAAPAVVKTVAAAPVAYAAAPAYYKSAPATYAAPAVVKTVAAAPVAYAAAPAYYKSAPASYAAPAIVKSALPVSYSAPAYYNSAPVTYASQAVVKAPLGYAAHSAYVAAPAVAYGHH